MTTYFAWVGAGEKFDSSLHSRCDLDIIKLTIDHQEGEVALATVVVAPFDLSALDQRHVFISYEKRLLFAGRLVGLPAQMAHDLVGLEFTAEPLDSFEKLKALRGSLQQTPYWDPLFVEPMDRDNPAEWLEGRSALYAWSRLDGTVCASDVFQGRHSIDLSPVFFADSLRVRLAETPLSQISVTLVAEWVQEAEGEINIAPKIATAFPGGMINTLTPNALQATWPQEGQRLGRSGYWVEKSRLVSVQPPRTGILHVYPTVTPAMRGWDDEAQVPVWGRFRRTWMTGTLVLGWRYRQKRREILRFTLSQKTQLDGAIHPRIRTLTLRLQELGLSPGAGTFFLTRRGRQAVEHSLERARAYLAASARCLEVEVTLPWEEALDLSLDHTVRLVDPRIPGGCIEGKVIAYQLCQEGVKAYAWVRFAASVGGRADPGPVVSSTDYVDRNYSDTTIFTHHQTASGLVYGDYSHQRPTVGIVDVENLSIHDLVRQVWVSHDALKQIDVLQRQQYPLRHHLQGVLEETPTLISLDLLNLKTDTVAEHFIQLLAMQAWTAPQQVDLSKGGWA